MREKVSESLDDAVEETRTVIDHQIDIVERSEKELLRFVRLNLIALGGFIPLLQLTAGADRVLTGDVIWWLGGSAICLTLAIILATFTYRNKLFFGGFGDAPQFTIFTRLDDIDELPAIDEEFPSGEFELPEGEEFYERLLWNYSKGIHHNNRESTYRYKLVNRITYWMTLGILMFFVASLSAFFDLPKPFLYLGLVIAVILGIVLSVSSVIRMVELHRRENDEFRFSKEEHYNLHHNIDGDIDVLGQLLHPNRWRKTPSGKNELESDNNSDENDRSKRSTEPSEEPTEEK